MGGLKSELESVCRWPVSEGRLKVKKWSGAVRAVPQMTQSGHVAGVHVLLLDRRVIE